MPIVRMVEGERQFALVRWGLIPAWVKDPEDFSLLINARGESVNEKPAFKNAMKRRRCLFPADGFYEWKRTARGKRPIIARPSAGGPIAFAGLWETWIGPNGEEMETAAIVTTHANATMAAVHHRAPVIVPPEQFDFWLDCRETWTKTAAAMLAPAPDGSMRGPRGFAGGQSRGQRRPGADRALTRRCRSEPRESAKRRSGGKPWPTTGQGALF